jgi:hypothetical protein
MSIFLRSSDVARTTFIGALVLSVVALDIVPSGNLSAQVPGHGQRPIADVSVEAAEL